MRSIVLVLCTLLLFTACTPPSPATPTPIPPTPAPALETYINTVHGYTIQHPTGLALDSDDPANVWLDNQILITVSNLNPEDARGDTPVIESAEDTTVGAYNGRRLRGFIGSVGGNTPQSYESVAIPHNNMYYVVTVYELKNDAPLDDTHQPGPIPADAMALFEQVLASLQLTA
jgi:hypothetical protein